MKRVESAEALRREVAAARARGDVVALVPTMGYLHEGHLSLVDRARSLADFVIVSIFVNPLQFGPGEDLARYPRDLDRDAAMAAARGVDLLFSPARPALFPGGDPAVQVVPLRLGDRLCGEIRPGHFQGVLTVVAKLFNLVQPDLAVFGQKDFQQAVLVRCMVRDLDFPVRIEVAPIVRESDGLALSSRNVYLSPEDREKALVLARTLARSAAAFADGERDPSRLRALVVAGVAAVQGIELQYAELVDPDDLEPVAVASPGSVLAIAALVGRTRLIDNVILV